MLWFRPSPIIFETACVSAELPNLPRSRVLDGSGQTIFRVRSMINMRSLSRQLHSDRTATDHCGIRLLDGSGLLIMLRSPGVLFCRADR